MAIGGPSNLLSISGQHLSHRTFSLLIYVYFFKVAVNCSLQYRNIFWVTVLQLLEFLTILLYFQLNRSGWEDYVPYKYLLTPQEKYRKFLEVFYYSKKTNLFQLVALFLFCY